MTRFSVASARGPYDVVVSEGFEGLGDFAPQGSAVLVTEARVGPLWADAVVSALGERLQGIVTLPEGEANKHLGTVALAIDGILAAGCDRDTTIVALGGGVLGDIAGFAAATALRGLRWLQIPTTLVAMVDSSIGGKVGVNHAMGKNLIGAFHPPMGVYIAVETLATLKPVELRAGVGEVVKTALVGDAALLSALPTMHAPIAAWAPIVGRCARVKGAIVSEDEHEHGRRAVLNAGHTVGHALETVLGPLVLRHGEAVAIGLVAEARFAARIGVCREDGLPDRLVRLFESRSVPHRWPEVDETRVLRAMAVDKKTRGDKIRLPLPVRAGEMVLVDLSRERLVELVAAAQETE